MNRLTLTAILAALFASTAMAGEWQIIGTRALGMGGAHVAVADDSNASYWNPAGYARLSGYQTRVDFGINLSIDPDLLDKADDIFDFIDALESGGTDYDTIIANINAGTATVAEVQQALALVTDGFRLFDEVDFGGVATAHLGSTTNVGRMGAAVNRTVTLNVMANIDLAGTALALSTGGTADANVNNVFTDNGDALPETPGSIQQDIEAIFAGGGVIAFDALADDMVVQAQAAGVDTNDAAVQQIMIDMATALVAAAGTVDLLTTNGTNLVVSGLMITEAVFTYGHPLADGKISLGLNVKAMQGESFYKVIPYDDFGDTDELMDEILDEDNREKSTAIGFDVGILFSPNERITLGLTGRNVNQPEFDFDGPGEWEVDAQARFGVAFKPFSTWILAADIDLTENELKGVDEIETQFLSVGTEYQIAKLVSLRAGANLNLKDEGMDELYTVGVGIGAGSMVRLDIAVALAGDREDLDLDYDLQGLDLPSGIGLSIGLQVSTKF